MIGVKKEANDLIVATGLGAEGADLGREGVTLPKGSLCQQQEQHSCAALTGGGRQSCLLQTAGV